MKLLSCLIIFIFNFVYITCQDSQWTVPHITHLTSNRLHIKLKAFNKKFSLDLSPNLFLSTNYNEALISKHNQVATSSNQHSNWCHYQGSVLDANTSWAAISYCNGKLNGIFEADGVTYHLQQSSQSVKKVKIFTDTHAPHGFHCGFKNSKTTQEHNRIRRGVPDHRSQFNVTRYVELVIVNDYKVYTKYGKNTEFIFDRSKQIANIVNSLYSSLNILIALVGVVIWTEKNEIDITSDSSQTLNNFLKYRRDVLIKMFPNDNAQLITGTSFESGIVGKALKQTLCTYEYSGGVNSDYSESLSLVATTVAHELGHNFGMEHDTNGCDCPGKKNCIMGPSSSFPSPRHWSSCSIKQIQEAFKHGIDHCLFNKPEILFKPSCGNGFVDQGEECDCGLAESCNNPCCNPATCKFAKGAECANGDCCDKQTCKLTSSESGHVCRPAKSVCDLPEKCDGLSEHCPKDLIVKDGTECSPGYAYCYAGQCNAREKQCKLLWGDSGEVADYRCYQHNMNASTSGNCGFDKQRKKFVPCDTVKDIICGRLHCSHRNEKLEYGPEGAAVISKSIEYRKGKLVSCYSAVIDLGLHETDPGLVPNGAKCGTNSMCVDQKCVSVNKYLMNKPCPYNCNNNGYCDNEGNCHCFDGFNSVDCAAYNNRYFLTITIYILFLLILPLITLSAFLIYHNQQRIKNWFRHKTTFSAQDYNNQKRKKLPLNMHISGPVETNVHAQVTTFSSLNSQVNHSTTSANTAANNGTILKPIRPAPPRPPPIPAHQSVILNQSNTVEQQLSALLSSDQQSSTLRKSSSIRRPRAPPPKPPPPPPPPSVLSSNPLPVICDSPTDSDPSVKNLISKFEKRDNR